MLSRDHGRELSDHECTEKLLATLPSTLWSQGLTNVGLCVEYPSITFEVTLGVPIWQPRYPHKPDAQERIAEAITGLLEAGVLEPSPSPCRETRNKFILGSHLLYAGPYRKQVSLLGHIISAKSLWTISFTQKYYSQPSQTLNCEGHAVRPRPNKV